MTKQKITQLDILFFQISFQSLHVTVLENIKEKQCLSVDVTVLKEWFYNMNETGTRKHSKGQRAVVKVIGHRVLMSLPCLDS